MATRFAILFAFVSLASTLSAQQSAAPGTAAPQKTEADAKLIGHRVAVVRAGDASDGQPYVEGELFMVVGVEKGRLRVLGGKSVDVSDVMLLDEAKRHFGDRVEAEESADAHLHLGVVLGALGDIPAAIKELDKAIQMDDLQQAYRDRGWLYLKDGESAKSLADLEKAIELKPNDHRALAYRAMLASWRFKQNEEAISYFDKAIDLAGDHSEYLRLRAFAKRAAGKTDEAIEDLVKSLKVDDMNAQAAFDLAVIHRENAQSVSDYKKSIELFSRCTEIKPKAAGAYTERGHTYEVMGDYQNAYRDYDMSIRLEPTALALVNRGLILEKTGRLELAFKDLQKAIKLDPKYAMAYSVLGRVYHEQGKFDESLAAYKKAIELTPKAADEYYRRSFVWETLRNGDKLIEDLTKAIELDPNDPRYYNQRAVAYDRFKNDLDRAIEDYTSALEVNDRFLFGYINRGQTYMKKRMYQEALRDAKEAVRLGNRVPAAVILAASAYRENEDYETALEYYDMALDLNPNWHRAQSERATVLKELGEDYSESL